MLAMQVAQTELSKFVFDLCMFLEMWVNLFEGWKQLCEQNLVYTSDLIIH